MPVRSSAPAFSGRLLSMYALSVMAREGPIHGYQLAQRIAERTQGSWRPGAGAIYPALNRLTERGFATPRAVGPRRTYSITPRGRRFLGGMVDRVNGSRGSVPDTTVLWMEIVGEGDRGRYVLRNVRTQLERAERYAEMVAGTDLGRAFDRELGDELRRLESRLREHVRRRAPRTGARAGPRA
jgi:DNA-binding PadR family transcriptional regulator